MKRYRITHTTQFDYDAPVTDSYNEVRLRPLQDYLQSCLSFRLKTDPPAAAAMHIDYFGNAVHRFNVLHEHRRLRVEAVSVVLVDSPPSLADQGASLTVLSGMGGASDEHYDFLPPTDYVPDEPRLREIAAKAESESGGTCAGLAAAALRLVHGMFRYEKGATHVHSSVCDTLSRGTGVCQDFAHILLGVLRSCGLPGRYVSGYLVPATSAEEVIGAQASHAWMEVFIPEAGWFGLDPTLGDTVRDRHVRVAYGRDYGDVAPIRGVYRGHSGQRMSVNVLARPALDDEGCEHLQEPAATPLTGPAGPPQQPQQQ